MKIMNSGAGYSQYGVEMQKKEYTSTVQTLTVEVSIYDWLRQDEFNFFAARVC
jgi:hypothetical protein